MPFETGPVLRFETRRLVGWRGWYALRVLLVVILAGLVVLSQWTYSRMLGNGFSAGFALPVVANISAGVFAAIGLVLAFLIAPVAAVGAFNSRGVKHMLPLLLVTRLSGRQIVWQSFAAGLIPGVSLWLCMLPFAALIVTWWGVDPTLVAIISAVTLSSMAACVASAVAFSLWSNGVLSTIAAVYTLWIAWLLTTSIQFAPGPYPAWEAIANPIVMLLQRSGARIPATPTEASLFVSGSLAFTVALLEIASATFRRSVLAREGVPAGKFAGKLAALRHTASRRPSWLPEPTLDGNPVLWREWHRARSAWGLNLFWIVYTGGATMATILGAGAYWVDDAVHPYLAGAAGYEVGLGLLALAIQAALAWSEEKSTGREGVDLLLSTPLSGKAIVLGKWLGVYRFIGFVVVFPLVSSFLVIDDVSRLPSREPGILGMLSRLVVVPVILGQVLLYGTAYVSLGLLLATRLAKPAYAVAWTLGIFIAVTLFVPTVAEMLFLRSNRGMSSGLGAVSPVGGPIAVMMTLFSSPYFGPARYVLPFAAGWLALAAAIAWVLYRSTIHRFDRWMGRIPTAASDRVPGIAKSFGAINDAG